MSLSSGAEPGWCCDILAAVATLTPRPLAALGTDAELGNRQTELNWFEGSDEIKWRVGKKGTFGSRGGSDPQVGSGNCSGVSTKLRLLGARNEQTPPLALGWRCVVLLLVLWEGF